VRRWNLSHEAISSYVTAALLAGCSGSQPPNAIPKAATKQIVSSAANGALLYAANTETSTCLEYVYVLTYPRTKLVFRLGPFGRRETSVDLTDGLCTDDAGNVYTVDPNEKGSGRVNVYKNGARDRSRTLTAFPGSNACIERTISTTLTT
jgi:hypothetical protein